VDTIEATREEAKGTHFDLADDSLVTRVIPAYLEELQQARQDIVRLDQEKEFQPHVGITNQLKEARKRLKELQKEFIKCLREARDALSDDDCRNLVLDILNEKLAGHLESYVTAHRQEVVAAVENWWDKYRVTLRDIEGERENSTKKLAEFMGELGYG
jgi:ribosome recycling factor